MIKNASEGIAFDPENDRARILKEVEDMLQKLDINTISPVEALLKLNEIKGLLNKKED